MSRVESVTARAVTFSIRRAHDDSGFGRATTVVQSLPSTNLAMDVQVIGTKLVEYAVLWLR